jgi:hypothetical protein
MFNSFMQLIFIFLSFIYIKILKCVKKERQKL